MREFSIHKLTIYSKEFGTVHIEVDNSQSIEKGHWRQFPPYNNRFVAAGNFQHIFIKGSHPTLFIYDSDGVFAKPIFVLENSYFRAGLGICNGFGRYHSKRVNLNWSYLYTQRLKELTMLDLAKGVVDTTWRLTGSKGLSWGAPLGKISIDGNSGSLFLKGDSEPEGTKHELKYGSGGVGIGSSKLPISISGSIEEMPSGGIKRIYTNKKGKLSLLDFEGFCMIGEVTGAFGQPLKDGNPVNGAGLFAIVFYANNEENLSGPLSVGFMWGTSMGLNEANKTNAALSVTFGRTYVWRV
ncbi:hypothetical protein BH20ACI1_BH20ACI1_00330 [soil metagenome]